MENEYRLLEMKIEVTYRCPLVCVHCSSDAYPDSKLIMDFPICEDIIKQAHSLGVQKLSFSGGEPLCWPDITRAVEASNALGINTAIYTSGNVDNQIQVFSDLHANGLKKAVFSLYSADPLNHEYITRISGSYDKTISAIENCQHIGIDTEIHFVATGINYKELPALCELSNSLKVSGISILRFVPQGRGRLLDKSIMSKEQNQDMIIMIKKLRQQGYSIRTGSPMNVFYLNNDPECLAGIDRLIISPDLRIYPCDAFKQISAEDIVGTVQDSTIETNSLSNCWEVSPYLCKVRDVLNSAPVDKCASCVNLSKCNTGCLAQKFLAYDKLERSPDPACMMK